MIFKKPLIKNSVSIILCLATTLVCGTVSAGYALPITSPFLDHVMSKGFSCPFVVDWDSDGDWDVLVGEDGGELALLLNEGDDTFVQTYPFGVLSTGGTINVGSTSTPAVVDWDNDGDFDLVVGEGSGSLHYYENNGAGIFAHTQDFGVTDAGPTIDVGNYSKPFVVDWNGDALQDIVVGAESGTLTHYEQLGDGTFFITNNFGTLVSGSATIDVGNNSSPVVLDADSDGDWDILVGEGTGTLNYYAQNSATGRFDEYTYFGSLATDPAYIDVGNMSCPFVVDWDADGHNDFLVGAEDGALYLYLHDDDADGYVGVDDCDATNFDIHVAQVDMCNGVDDNCDGVVDEGTEYYVDADGDGYGDPTTLISTSCAAPVGYITQGGDCNDVSSQIHPAQEEICDFDDNNCDGLIDDITAVDMSSWYFDGDGDTWGNPLITVLSYDQPLGYVANKNDCNDEDNTIYDGAPETCGDGIDQNCSGADLICVADDSSDEGDVENPENTGGETDDLDHSGDVDSAGESGNDTNTPGSAGSDATDDSASTETASASGGCSLNRGVLAHPLTTVLWLCFVMAPVFFISLVKKRV